MTKAPLKHLCLIDGSGYIFRAYFGYPKMNRADGTPVNAVYGFSQMVSKLVQEHEADYIGVIFDKARRSFRNDIYPDYKAHRDDAPEDLIPQFALIRQACESYSIPALDMEGFEADDLIATYAKMAAAQGAKVTIVSSDKDLMQLVDDNISMLDPMKNITVTRDTVFEKFGGYPENVIDIQALAGDSADNVPGVPGIGVKTAAQLIGEFGTLENLLENAHTIKQPKRRQSLIDFAEQARISKELVTLKTDVEIDKPLEFFARKDADTNVLREFLLENNFKRLLALLDSGTMAGQNSNARQNHTGQNHTGNSTAGNSVPVGQESAEKSNSLQAEGFENAIGQYVNTAMIPSDITAEYVRITDKAALTEWLTPIYNTGVLAVDTETSGLNVANAKIVGISLSHTIGKACYIPLSHGIDPETNPAVSGTATQNTATQSTATQSTASKAPPADTLDLFGDFIDTPQKTENQNSSIETEKTADTAENTTNKTVINMDVSDVIDVLKPILQDDSILKIGQNLKYDMSILKTIGLDIYPYADTMLMSFTTDAGLNGHGMDALAKQYLNYTCIKFSDVCGTGKKQIPFWQADMQLATKYAAEDADITLRLYYILSQRLTDCKLHRVYEYLEKPLAPVLAEMERSGIYVDVADLAVLSTEYGILIDNAQKAIDDIAAPYSDNFNASSPKQLGEMLFTHLGLKGGKKTKSGAYSTGVDVLQSLKGQHPVIESILSHRTYSKLKSTYTDALQKQVSPNTGRVHTSFNMVGAQTGRLSSTEPNLQNIPARNQDGIKIRQCFKAETGNVLVSLDYSQIELRIIAHVAQDETLIQAFKDGQDIHTATASSVFGIPIESVTPDIRSKAKAINFGIIYGVSAHGLSEQIGCSRSEAKEFMDNYFAKFPKIKIFMAQAKQQARDTGYVETIFGRRIHLLGAVGDNAMARNHADRQAINAPIQGAAADVIKYAMIKVHNAIKDIEDYKILLQVHDELIFECPQQKAESLIDLVRPLMENAHKDILEIDTPLVVDAGIGENWSQAH